MSISTIMKISHQGQIRIPKKIMISLGIEEGDYLEVDVEKNQIVLKPRKLIDPSQGWYWTKEWQEMESEADEDIEKDQLSERFESVEEGLKIPFATDEKQDFLGCFIRRKMGGVDSDFRI